MAKPKIHYDVPFFIGVITRAKAISENGSIGNASMLNELKRRISHICGEVKFMSDILDFDRFTDYYEPEMGKDLIRFWVAFEKLSSPSRLVELKLICGDFEQEFADENGNRTINIDPGYLTEAKVILASFKDFAHRIYLDRGVFADMQLIFHGKRYVPKEWTFVDYKTEEAQEFFQKLRNWYREQLKSKAYGDFGSAILRQNKD